ncbi:hypothetical protein TUM19329_03350 [Legionella antarctica]|uniref:Uncharacterized protein n=1 Tax=Legionella antarctica TaxID=2708020 RepID=A0A6F8SZW9_9GAMM|nr:lpg0008 family Dot/Icm T4SS effector [Legionella antarctica]BCA93974.1 hypothetical protein TUM19329_03350 [Legionella antarctica]
MTFTFEQIKQLENPYQELGTSDALAEHREELNKLSTKEKQNLASRMILACPQEELDNFGLAINSLKSETEDESFHTVISHAHEVKKRVLELLDPTQQCPYELLTNEEVNDELFTPFKDLALKILEKNESAIAVRLALTTPTHSRSQLAHHINNTFDHSELATKTANAFIVNREIERFLLGDKPELFFSSPEFNVDLCLEFTTLCSSLLKGHEQSIGEKLAQLDAKTRHDISRHLEMMCPKACDQQNPFRFIAQAMAANQEKEEEKQKQEIAVQTVKPIEVVTATSNPNGMFSSQLRARKNGPETALASSFKYESDSESNLEQDSWFSNCCGLFKG